MKSGKVLHKQLVKLGLDSLSPPTDAESWLQFLHMVQESYEENDKQRTLNENMIDTAMFEMDRLNELVKKQAEMEVQHTEEKFKHVIEAVPSIVCWLDRSGKILGCNDKMASLFQKSILELTGIMFSQLGFVDIENAILQFKDGSKTESQLDYTFNLIEEKRYYKILFKKFSNDQMIAVIGIDLTEDIIKSKELEAAQAATLASSRMASLGEMAAGIAHEINNPLAVISSVIHQIKKRMNLQEFESIPERLDRMQTTVMRISRIISGLRTFARDGEKDPFQETSVKKIIDETLELATERLKSLNIELRVDSIPEDLMIDCRATQLSQVILNLINNARDAVYLLPNRWIRIHFEDLGPQIHIAIEDSGDGISAEIQEKIFRPFFTTKEVGVGTGLGLSISMGIIQTHQGRLYIDSVCDHTKFIIEIPKKQLENSQQKVS